MKRGLQGASPLDDLAATPLERSRANLLMTRSVIHGALGTMGFGLVSTAVVALTLTLWLPGADTAYSLRVWAWWALVSVILLHGVLTSWRYRRGAFTDADLQPLARSFAWGANACAVAWGSAAWLLLPAPTPIAESIVLVGIAMILMGAGSALAGFQRTLFTHIVLMDLVLCAGLLRLEGQAHAVYAFAFLALGGLVLANARRQEQLILAAVLIRLRLEAQQAATQRARDDAEAARRTAERANASKTTFLAAAGHDLRQPMHALVQYFAQIRRKNADAALQTTIAAAGQAVDALGDLLDAVLEVSKLMMGSVQPVVTRVDLPLLFDRLAAQLRPLAESKGLALVLQAPAGAAASSDAVLLERVLRNLCVNAVNFTATGTVTLRAALRPSHVLIQVLDTGCGIAPAHQAQVFEPLFQVGNAARDRQKGLGLGLSIVKDLCALLDIRLRLRSTPGRGTLFSLHLPLPEAAPAPQAAEVEAAPRHLRGSLVLLIDDNSASLEATATTLRDAGCSVLTATSAAQALQALAGQDELPHAVLSDYRLADGLTGLDAIATVREHLAQRFGAELAVPALLISGDTAPAELARVQASGLSLLHKPLAPERLLAALNRLLASLSTTA